MDQSRQVDVPEDVVEDDQRQMVFIHVTVELDTLFEWQNFQLQPLHDPGSEPGPSDPNLQAPSGASGRGPTVIVKGRKDIHPGAFVLLSAPWTAYKKRFLLPINADPDQSHLAAVTTFSATFKRKPVYFALSRITAIRTASFSAPSSSAAAANTLLLDLDPKAVAWLQIPRQQLEEDLGLPANSNAPAVRCLQHYQTEPTSLRAMQHYLNTAEHLLQTANERAAQPGPTLPRPFPPAPDGKFSSFLLHSSSHVQALEAAANLASCTSPAGRTPTPELLAANTTAAATASAATTTATTTTTTAAATVATGPVDGALSGQEQPSAIRAVHQVNSRLLVVPSSPAVSLRPVMLLQGIQQSETGHGVMEGRGAGGGGGDASGCSGAVAQTLSGVEATPTSSRDGKAPCKRTPLPQGEETSTKRQRLQGQHEDTADSGDRDGCDDQVPVHEVEENDEDKGGIFGVLGGSHAQQLNAAIPMVRQLEVELASLKQEMQMERMARQQAEDELAQERAVRAQEAQQAAANARSLEELGQEVRWERADRLAAEAEVAAILRRADEAATRMSQMQQQHEEAMELQRRAGQVALATAMQQLEQQLAEVQQRFEVERTGRLAAERRIQELRREHGAKEAAGRAQMETFLSSVKRAVQRFEADTSERGRSGEVEMGEVEAAASGCM